MKWVRGGVDVAMRPVHADPTALFVNEAKYTEPAPASELQFRQLMNILRGRRRLILTIAGFGALLAGGGGLLIAPKYSARSQVVIEPLQTGGRATAGADTAEESAIETHVIALGSRTHLQHVLDSLSNDTAAEHPTRKTAADFGSITTKPADSSATPDAATERPPNPLAADTRSLSLDELGRRLNIWIGSLGRHVGQGSTLDLDTFEHQVQITREGRSRVITVSATASRPESSATFANRIAQLYVNGQIEMKRAYASRTVEEVGRRVSALESEMQLGFDSNQSRLGTAQAISSQALETEARLRQLEREAKAGALSDSLQRRELEIRSQEDAVSPDVRVLTLASVPNRPSSPNPILFIFPALVISLIGGGLLAVVLEQLDQRMRSERDIVEALAIPCLGLVPQFSRRLKHKMGRRLLSEPFSAYSEAIRSIIATLQLAAPRRTATVVLISSSVRKEGKTTLAVSVASNVALAGRRVLLIDLDFRNPSILRKLEGKADFGVLDLMQSDGSPGQVIKTEPNLGIDYLPMLRCPADPMVAALFASERLPRLIHQLRESYDCVIMDGPPLLGVAESRLLAMVADRVLFVVKWGSTRREVARNALARLGNPDGFEGERVAKPVAVLTQVDLNKHARYRYGDVGESMAEYNRHYRSARGSDRGDRPIKQKMAAAANGVPLSWRRDENDKSFR